MTSQFGSRRMTEYQRLDGHVTTHGNDRDVFERRKAPLCFTQPYYSPVISGDLKIENEPRRMTDESRGDRGKEVVLFGARRQKEVRRLPSEFKDKIKDAGDRIKEEEAAGKKHQKLRWWHTRANEEQRDLLKTMKFQNTTFSPEGLLNAKDIVVLNMTGCAVGNEAMSWVSTFLQQNHTLRRCILQGNKLTADGIMNLYPGLRATHSLTDLDVSLNPIGDEGMNHLVSAFSENLRNTKIAKINVSTCDLSPSSGYHLSRLIRDFKSMEVVLAWRNRIGCPTDSEMAGVNLILDELCATTRIKLMDLSCNNLSEDIVARHATMMEQVARKKRLEDIEKHKRAGKIDVMTSEVLAMRSKELWEDEKVELLGMERELELEKKKYREQLDQDAKSKKMKQKDFEWRAKIKEWTGRELIDTEHKVRLVVNGNHSITPMTRQRLAQFYDVSTQVDYNEFIDRPRKYDALIKPRRQVGDEYVFIADAGGADAHNVFDFESDMLRRERLEREARSKEMDELRSRGIDATAVLEERLRGFATKPRTADSGHRSAASGDTQSLDATKREPATPLKAAPVDEDRAQAKDVAFLQDIPSDSIAPSASVAVQKRTARRQPAAASKGRRGRDESRQIGMSTNRSASKERKGSRGVRAEASDAFQDDDYEGGHDITVGGDDDDDDDDDINQSGAMSARGQQGDAVEGFDDLIGDDDDDEGAGNELFAKLMMTDEHHAAAVDEVQSKLELRMNQMRERLLEKASAARVELADEDRGNFMASTMVKEASAVLIAPDATTGELVVSVKADASVDGVAAEKLQEAVALVNSPRQPAEEAGAGAAPGSSRGGSTKVANELAQIGEKLVREGVLQVIKFWEQIRTLGEIGSPSDADIAKLQDTKRQANVFKQSLADRVLGLPQKVCTGADDVDFFINFMEDLVKETDREDGNAQLLAALLEQIDADFGSLFEERGLAATAACDGSIAFLKTMLDTETVRFDAVDLVSSCFFNQGQRIPLSHLVVASGRIDFTEFADDLAELWQEFFEDVASTKRAIPREDRTGRNELLAAMLANEAMSFDALIDGTDGNTCFSRACAEGDVDVAMLLINHGKVTDVNHANADGMTALMSAVLGNSADVVQVLLGSTTLGDVDVNAVSSNGSALDLATLLGRDKEIVTLLTEHGASATAKSAGGKKKAAAGKSSAAAKKAAGKPPTADKKKTTASPGKRGQRRR
jgi:hypothetical protein